jgi:hypothetical protein
LAEGGELLDDLIAEARAELEQETSQDEAAAAVKDRQTKTAKHEATEAVS